jgi:MerR family transcriptional regulator, copper efflux regulator
MTTLTIGDLAVLTGSNVPTIRYYEEIGLLPPADRRPSGHRVYDQSDLKRLTFIRRCRDFGFSIDQVRRLIDLAASPESDCTEARNVAQEHLASVRKKLIDLRALEQSLTRFVESCSAACAGGPMSRCVLVEDLLEPVSCCQPADHALAPRPSKRKL